MFNAPPFILLDMFALTLAFAVCFASPSALFPLDADTTMLPIPGIKSPPNTALRNIDLLKLHSAEAFNATPGKTNKSPKDWVTDTLALAVEIWRNDESSSDVWFTVTMELSYEIPSPLICVTLVWLSL